MPTNIQYKFYWSNGIIQLLPATQQNEQTRRAASPQEVQSEIQQHASATDEWSQKYTQNLSKQLQDVKSGAIDNDPKYNHYVVANDGTFTTKDAIDPATGNVKAPVNIPNLQTDSPYDKKNQDQGGAGGSAVGAGTGGGNNGGAGGTSSPSVAPENGAYRTTAQYKSLPPDLQKLVDTAFSSFQGGPDQQKAFTDALNNAKALADPYTKSQLALATAEFKLQLAKNTSDYQSQKSILNTTIKDIQDELTLNKDNLTLSEQADLATTLRNYTKEGLDLSDSAAEKGLIFATGEKSNQRMQATNDAQYQDVVQSSKRQYNFNIQQLQLRADRGDADARAQLAKLETDNSSSLSSIGLNAEKVLGSNNTSGLNIPGYTVQGGSIGSIAQDENKSIIDIADKAINTK